jgi:zinc protease
VQLTLRYGTAENLKDLITAAGFVDELMLKGTKKSSQQELQDELDRLQARLSAGAGLGGGRRGGGGIISGAPGSITFSIQAKRDALPAVLNLLRQVLREPALPADQFELLKRSRLARIEQTRSEPMLLAARYVQRQTSPYPKNDVRYIPTIDEEIDQLNATTYEQVKKVYDDYLGSQAGELVIIGDFDADACLKVLGETLNGWKAKQPYARIERTVPAKLVGAKEVINTPDKANANFFAMLVLQMRDDDPDYPAMVMANYILGGGSLSSRLGDRVRQKEGLSYTVASMMTVDAFDQRGSLSVFAICNPENISKVEKAINEELEKLLKDGVTAAELDAAKKGYLQQQTVGRTSEAGLLGQLSSALHRGRTMRFHEDVEKKIESLTPDQVNSALRNFIDPQKFVTATAGDFSKKPK